MLFKSRVREVPGKSPRNFRGSSGKVWEVQGLSRSSGGAWLPPSDSPKVSSNQGDNWRRLTAPLHTTWLGGRFKSFLIFFLVGEGEEGVRGAGGRGGGGSVFYWKSQGVLQEGEGPRGCLRRIGDFFLGPGGGAKYFFRGRNVHQDDYRTELFYFRIFFRVIPALQGCRNGRFGKRSFCPLPKTRGFDENWRNSDIAFYLQKQGSLLLKPRKSTKMTKLAGVTPTKWPFAPFAKSTVLTTLSFRNENSAQRGSFGPDIPPKTSVRPSKSWKHKHFGADIPRGRPWKKLRSEKLRADFSFPRP